MAEFSSGASAQTSGQKPALVGQWSWAGFMFNWLYLVGHNIIGLGVILFIIGLVLTVIPIVNIIGGLYWLAVAIFLGIKGHEYAWASGIYKSVDEFNASHRVVNTMGKVWFFIVIILVIVMFILAAFGVGLGILAGLAGRG